MVVGRDGFRVLIRFPKGMEEALNAAAASSGRSRNSEIVLRLAHSIGYELTSKTAKKRK